MEKVRITAQIPTFWDYRNRICVISRVITTHQRRFGSTHQEMEETPPRFAELRPKQLLGQLMDSIRTSQRSVARLHQE